MVCYAGYTLSDSKYLDSGKHCLTNPSLLHSKFISERLVSAAYAASSWKAMSCAKKLYKVFSSKTGISPL